MNIDQATPDHKVYALVILLPRGNTKFYVSYPAVISQRHGPAEVTFHCTHRTGAFGVRAGYFGKKHGWRAYRGKAIYRILAIKRLTREQYLRRLDEAIKGEHR